MDKTIGSVIVSWDFSHDLDKSILIVGEKMPGEKIEIINAIQGEKAIELRDKLITQERTQK